jgi:hypothetical protein
MHRRIFDARDRAILKRVELDIKGTIKNLDLLIYHSEDNMLTYARLLEVRERVEKSLVFISNIQRDDI